MFFANSGSRPSTPRSRSRSPITTSAAKARTRLIGRERGYHGVGFGGIAVGGIVNNRKFSARSWPASTTCRRPTIASSRLTKGEPEWGAHLADELSASWRCMMPRRSRR